MSGHVRAVPQCSHLEQSLGLRGQEGGGKRGEPPHPLLCIEESQEENMLPETPG